MAAPLGGEPGNQRMGWAVAHLPSRTARERAREPECESRRPEKR